MTTLLDERISWKMLAIGEDMLCACPPDDAPITGERWYVAGPMRGYEKWNFPAFDRARDKLLARGIQVISPADLDRARGFSEDATEFSAESFAKAMWIDTLALLYCTGIYLLPGWAKSTGAKYERAVADKLAITITYDDDAEIGTVELDSYVIGSMSQ